jgi:hypothetical protein
MAFWSSCLFSDRSLRHSFILNDFDPPASKISVIPIGLARSSRPFSGARRKSKNS